jgi:DNA-binding CsgD family transcriptional regulator
VTQRPKRAADAPAPGIRPSVLILLIAVQAFCAAFFVWDDVADFLAMEAGRIDLHQAMEYLVTLSLIVAIVIEARLLAYLLRRAAHMERGFSIAAGALNDLMEGYFTGWGLTPAEQDVATFLIKGCDTPEIARLRGSAEGTVKAHLNAIYRKAGVSGRAALVSILIEDLMNEPLIRSGLGDTDAAPRQA